jgi:hypothetical protein
MNDAIVEIVLDTCRAKRGVTSSVKLHLPY